MNWFRENRFRGTFIVALGVALFLALWFLFNAKNDWDEASARFRTAATELDRLERLAPYPSADNLRKMETHAEDYSTALAKLKNELKIRVAAPAGAMAPNEFQSRLRIALNSVTDKARANKAKLPDKFFLGFNDYVSALPLESAAPLLGQELAQIEWLLNRLLDAPVDALTAFHRAPLPEENNSSAAGPFAKPKTAKNKLVQRNVVEATFYSTPAAARKVINQIAVTDQPFCIIRLLRVRNENGKGPPRETADETSAAGVHAPSKATPVSALNFIVGTEKIETTATIEFVRFTL